MISTPKWLGLLAVAFVAGSFISSPELRAFAANTVGSSDIINESIQSVDIKNSEVKASDIATDAVGAAEIQGVTKLLFGQCSLTNGEASVNYAAQSVSTIECTISGVDSDDSAIAMMSGATSCFEPAAATAASGRVYVQIKNDCNSISDMPGLAKIAIVVFDK
jgi:hypothetical protein